MEDYEETTRETWSMDMMEESEPVFEDQEESAHLFEDQEEMFLQEEMQKSTALDENQLNEQSHDNKTLVAARGNVEQEFESHQVDWQWEKTSLFQAAGGFKKYVQDMQRDAKDPVEASYRAQLEEHRDETRKIASDLKKAKDSLETERLRWQQEKNSLLKGHRKETKKIASALKKAEDSLETERLCWQQEKKSLLVEHRKETRKITSALRKAEDLLENERRCWQQEKMSLLERDDRGEPLFGDDDIIPVQEEMEKSTALSETQLDEQKCENKTIAAARKTVEQKLESHPVELQEEKTSLHQPTEGFKKTVHDMVQESKETVERSQVSHQIQLEEQREETRKIASALRKAEDLL